MVCAHIKSNKKLVEDLDTLKVIVHMQLLWYARSFNNIS